MTESGNIDIPHLRAYIERHYQDIPNAANADWANKRKPTLGLPEIDYKNPTLKDAQAFTGPQISILVEHLLLNLDTRKIIEDAIVETGLTDPEELGDYLKNTIVSDLEKLNTFLRNRKLEEIQYGFNVQPTSIWLSITPTGSNAISYSSSQLREIQARLSREGKTTKNPMEITR